MVRHYDINLRAYERGYHLITKQVVNQIDLIPQDGIFSLFIKHTSAAICLNENADPSVRVDFEKILNHLVPENLPFLSHTIEGPDDMPAHIKAALIGNSLTIPIKKGRLDLGTWQGIYLCEFRNHASSRRLTASIFW